MESLVATPDSTSVLLGFAQFVLHSTALHVLVSAFENLDNFLHFYFPFIKSKHSDFLLFIFCVFHGLKPVTEGLDKFAYYLDSPSFMKHIQWVFIFFPLLCPNSGSWPIALMIFRVGISTSDHLKTSVPLGFKTRMHS